LEVRRIQSGAFRERLEDVVLLYFRAPHRFLVIDGTVTSARLNTTTPHIGAPVFHSRAVLHLELSKANSMRTSALPFCLARLGSKRPMTTTLPLSRLGGGWRLLRLSWLIDISFWWQFVASVAWVSQTLVYCVVKVMSACNISFVDLLMFPFDFWGGRAAIIHATFLAYLHDTWGSFLHFTGKRY
jgi:hypothetical protein